MPIRPDENPADFIKRLAHEKWVMSEAFEDPENRVTFGPRFAPSQVQASIQKKLGSVLQKNKRQKNLSTIEIKSINNSIHRPEKFEVMDIKYSKSSITKDSAIFQIFLQSRWWKWGYEIKGDYIKKIDGNYRNDDGSIESYHFKDITYIKQLSPTKIFWASEISGGGNITSFGFYMQVFSPAEAKQMRDFINAILWFILQNEE